MHFIDLAGWFFFIVNVVGFTVLLVMSSFFIDVICVESLFGMFVLSVYKGGSLMVFFDVNFWTYVGIYFYEPKLITFYDLIFLDFILNASGFSGFSF